MDATTNCPPTSDQKRRLCLIFVKRFPRWSPPSHFYSTSFSSIFARPERNFERLDQSRSSRIRSVGWDDKRKN